MSKIRASSLMETIVSLLIISIVLVIASSIFVNVSQSNSTYQQTTWDALAQNLMDESIANNDYSDKDVQSDQYQVSQKVEDYDNNKNLSVFTVTISIEDQELYSLKRIVANE